LPQTSTTKVDRRALPILRAADDKQVSDIRGAQSWRADAFLDAGGS
jgi:hypothetical protein